MTQLSHDDNVHKAGWRRFYVALDLVRIASCMSEQVTIR